jgi:hypothetical protein
MAAAVVTRVARTSTHRPVQVGDVDDIDMSGKPERALDPRLVSANVVGMDALRAR